MYVLGLFKFFRNDLINKYFKKVATWDDKKEDNLAQLNKESTCITRNIYQHQRCICGV